MTTLLSDLKGAQAMIVLALLQAKGRSLSNKELCRETGYRDNEAVAEGLSRLGRRGWVVNLTSNIARNEWALTATCRQMFLGQENTEALPAAPEQLPEETEAGGCAEKPHISASSSSSDSLITIDSLTNYYLGGCAEKPHISESTALMVITDPDTAEIERLAALMTREHGTPRKHALKAVGVALYNEDTYWVEWQILTWAEYCLSHGRGITARQFLVAKRITDGETCPDWFDPLPSEFSTTITPRQARLRELARLNAARLKRWRRDGCEYCLFAEGHAEYCPNHNQEGS